MKRKKSLHNMASQLSDADQSEVLRIGKARKESMQVVSTAPAEDSRPER